MVSVMRTNENSLRAYKHRRSLHRQKAHTKVLSCLLRDIRNGVYTQGQKLPSERDLMEAFSVGRPAVREALSALCRMGLIEVSAGMRAKVCKLTLKPILEEMQTTLQVYSGLPDGWRQLHDVRLFFESSVVRQLAHQITNENLATLRTILQNQRSFLDNSEIRSFAEADIAFHYTLVESLGNSFLSLLAEGFADWLITPLYASVQIRRQSEICYSAHMAIFEALEKRDSEAAEQAMRDHLEEMRTLYQTGIHTLPEIQLSEKTEE